MTTELTKAAQQALEALKNVTDYDQINAARRALQSALTTSQPAQAGEMPPDWFSGMSDGFRKQAWSIVRASLPTQPAAQATPERHLTVTTNQHGDAVMVSWQDDEHRILEVVWERTTPPQQAAGEPVGDGFLAFKAKCDEVFGWVVGLGGYEDAVREAWRAAHPAPGVPEGFALVPMSADRMTQLLHGHYDSPTDEQANAFYLALRAAEAHHRAMLAAAQAKGADPEDLAAAGVMLMGRRADHA